MNKKKKLISKQDKIFIAGSRGMAGKAIHKALRIKGYGSEKSGGKFILPSREELDLSNEENVRSWFENNKPDVVILAAAKVGGIYANSTYPYQFISENLKIELNTIESAFKNNVKRFLFLGSSCIYPKMSKQPIKEEYLLSGALEKTNEYYAIAKISGLKLCQALREQYGFDAISLMPTNLYGPGDNYDPQGSHVIAGLIRRFLEAKKNNAKEVTCWGSGSPLREFLYSEDLGEACRFALEYWDPNCDDAPLDENGNPLNLMNVGTGIDISIGKLVEIIASKTNFKGNIIWDKNKPDGTPKKLLDISKFKQFGWEAKISLNDGLDIAIKEFSDLYLD